MKNKTIEKMIDDIQKHDSMGAYEYLDIKDVVKLVRTYTTQEVKKHLEIAANEANILNTYTNYKTKEKSTSICDGMIVGDCVYIVNKESITNINIELT